MTIFHNIKYPIGNPPTLEQLQAVPYRIFEKWRRKLRYGPNIGPKEIYHKMDIVPNSFFRPIPNPDWDKAIPELRLMITRMRKP